MTTKEDWRFRRDYLRHQADHFDSKAESLKQEAIRYRALADRAASQVEEAA